MRKAALEFMIGLSEAKPTMVRCTGECYRAWVSRRDRQTPG